MFTPGDSSSQFSRVNTLTSTTVPYSPCGTRSEVSRTSRAFSPRVEVGQVIADGPSTDGGEISLGRNMLIGFMTWEGYNYEDAVLINERLVKDDIYTSIHVEEFETESRDTKLGPPCASRITISLAQTDSTSPECLETTATPESTADLYSIPVATIGASGISRGTA